MDKTEPDLVRASLGRALGSGYRILRLLGRGGMGAVYLAREESLERLVAVKVLSHERGLDATSRERFRREARTAGRLMHPNIVPLHAFGEADGMMYLVMGYVPGESLAARLARDARLGIGEVRRIVAELAEALDHAHRQGVVHRDVKPDNVLIEDESGRALLADFGVAKALGAGGTMTQAGSVVGTPDYMSPEQAAGNVNVDGRSDLYSLGALAYALLAGRPPFDGDARAVLAKHLTQDPPPLRTLRPDVPDDFSAAVARCLAKDPAARWPDARAFREAIAPTGLDEEELPEPLDALDGRAAMLLPLLILVADAAWYAWLKGNRNELAGKILLVLSAGLFLFQLPWLASAARLGRGRGFSQRQMIGAFLREPSWWYLLWYPRRFRRTGDIWARLPRAFRLLRISVSLLLANALVMVPLVTAYLNGPAFEAATGLDVNAVIGRSLRAAGWAFLCLALMFLIALALCARLILGLGLQVHQRRRVTSILFSTPTSQRHVWKRPEIARLLLPAPAATPALTEPRLPHEFAEALAREATGRTGEARRELERAADEARAIAAELDATDAEIARLARDADPEEAARLRQRLEALGPESPDEGEERRQMRRLLSEHAGLLARVSERLEQMRARRDERAQALRELWRGARTEAARTLTRAPDV